MAQIVVTSRQTLRVVTQLMLTQQSDGTREPDLHAAVHERIFQPLRALKAVVHELAVIAEGMAEQQHRDGDADEDRNRAP